MDTKRKLRQRVRSRQDLYNTGLTNHGLPKLNAFDDSLYINDFNHSLTDVLKQFCKDKGFILSLCGSSCVLITAPIEEYEKYIEQLKLFYL